MMSTGSETLGLRSSRRLVAEYSFSGAKGTTRVRRRTKPLVNGSEEVFEDLEMGPRIVKSNVARICLAGGSAFVSEESTNKREP